MEPNPNLPNPSRADSSYPTLPQTVQMSTGNSRDVSILAAQEEDHKILLGIFGNMKNLTLFASSVRFLVALPICLLLSVIFNDPRIGGFACLGSFMILLADIRSNLWQRLIGLFIVLVVLAAALLIGYLCQYLSYGEWVVIAIASFGAGMLPFAEFFWWIVSKYFLIFLMVSLFGFTPDLPALEGYGLGSVIALIVIILDSVMWRLNKLGVRPMAQLKEIFGGVRNHWSFGIIFAAILLLSLISGELAGVQELAWVGIAVIYLLGTKISIGLGNSVKRVLGTALGYASVVAIFSYPNAASLSVLGPFIILFGAPVPYFLATDYLMGQVCITGFILLDLEWMMKAYGGDANLLSWRLFDTCWGAVWAIVGFIIIAIIRRIAHKRQSARHKGKTGDNSPAVQTGH